MANHEVSQHIHDGKIGHLGACEPWGYVAPVVAAVVTRATGVRHIYLILQSKIPGYNTDSEGFVHSGNHEVGEESFLELLGIEAS